MNDRAARQLALKPDTGRGPAVPVGLLRRTAKIVGDLLWWSFLTVVFASITIGVATELFL